MTTIAYRNGILAADSQVTWWNTRHVGTKIFVNKKIAIAVSGSVSPAMIFVDWYLSGSKKKPEMLEKLVDDDQSFDAIIMRPDKVLTADHFCRPVEVEDKFFALGSGRDLAMGAMELGASAGNAVFVAAKHDIFTGGAIHCVSRYDFKLAQLQHPGASPAQTGLLVFPQSVP